ncbi:arsenic transporter [Sphingomonas koreensis]|nr:arsenic transporter [Sphingomonas koreensis]
MTSAAGATIAICLIATLGILIRPWRLPEAIWPCLGAVALIAFGLLPMRLAGIAIAKGSDVYLFLIGMMLLSEMARREGLFDWLAGHAVRWARGSRLRLFGLVYAIGAVVTTFMSNDATAVVMTPAVFAACRKAEADPLPALFACALIANAASFVLPISNPANLVLYGGAMPPLGAWLASFALPSALSIGATYVALRLVMRERLAGGCIHQVDVDLLSSGGRIAFLGIAVTALLLLTMSALNQPLGLPTALAGIITATILLLRERRGGWAVLRSISWSVLPLVAGLFVLVEALAHIGLIDLLATAIARGSATAPQATAAALGGGVALGSNAINNLPAGLIASTAIFQAHPAKVITDAALIGVDLGPNLSITGSLATILWLTAIRREGGDVTFGRFLKVGALVMPPALVLALAARIALG